MDQATRGTVGLSDLERETYHLVLKGIACIPCSRPIKAGGRPIEAGGPPIEAGGPPIEARGPPIEAGGHAIPCFTLFILLS